VTPDPPVAAPTSGQLPFVGADRLRELVPPADAVDALEAALRDGTAPGTVPARSSLRVAGASGGGELLLMPAAGGRFAGVKLATVAPGNPARGLPRIQGVYVLFDAATLAPVALVDAVALTSLRTPAVSALALRHLAPPGPVRLVVFGRGPQGIGHVEAVAAVRPVSSTTVLGRDAGPAAVADAVRAADVVVCATTARHPLFDPALVRPGAVVIAVGSHEPTAREVGTALVRRAHVVVETRGSALAEAGDVLLAAGPGLPAAELVDADLAELVTGRPVFDPARPRLFKSVGEAWEDLVVASLAVTRLTQPGA